MATGGLGSSESLAFDRVHQRSRSLLSLTLQDRDSCSGLLMIDMSRALESAVLTGCDVHGANILPCLVSALLWQSGFIAGSAYAGGNQRPARALGQRSQLLESISSSRNWAAVQLSKSLGITVVLRHMAFSSCSLLLGLSRHVDYVLASAQLSVTAPWHITYTSAGAGSMRRSVRTGLALDM